MKVKTDKPYILIVDDIPENLLALEKILRKVDAAVIRANCGNAALSATLDHEFAVIILDVQMPEMNGYEVAEYLKFDERTASIPIIFVTAIDREESKEIHGYETGAVDFIFKPYNEFILLSKVRVFLELYRMRSNLENMVKVRTAELRLNTELLRREIEEHKKIGVELQNIRNYLNSIIDSMPSVLFSIDSDGKITNWNHAAVQLTGIEEKEAFGSLLWEKAPWIIKFREDCQRILNNGKASFYQNEKFEAIGEFYFNVSIFPIIEENFVKAVGFRLDDITEMVSKEEQLQRAQKLETVGTLAGGLAHDFNNVLSGITGTLSVLQYKIKKYENLKKDELEKYLETIGQSGERAIDIVQHLLSLVRKNEAHYDPVDLRDVIANVYKLCKNSFNSCVVVHPDLPKTSTLVKADLTQLEQVFLNLMLNAYHAMTLMRSENQRQGGILGIKIDFITYGDEIVQANPDAEAVDYWKVIISDTGVGIPRDNLTKIFDPFFTTKQKNNGSGLGLVMVSNIIKQHRGFIKIDSEIGIGSVFNVYFPVLNMDEIKKKVTEESEIMRGSGLILVVDDEEIMRGLAGEILTECGYRTICAQDGEEAMEIYCKRHAVIDIVLLDVMMPKKGGIETLSEIRSINPLAKVLLMSGFEQDQSVLDSLNSGMTDFIHKPLSIDTLSKKIYHLLYRGGKIETVS